MHLKRVIFPVRERKQSLILLRLLDKNSSVAYFASFVKGMCCEKWEGPLNIFVFYKPNDILFKGYCGSLGSMRDV